jgi:chromosome segregation ATPase
MDSKKLYMIGKKFYDDNKHEDFFENFYIEIDDLLDELDSKRMEIKLLIEDKESLESENTEDRMKKLYKELSEIAVEIENVDTSEIEKQEKEMGIFKAKNKYKFMQLETAEQKYADALTKGSKDLDAMLENLKRLRLGSLNLQKKLERYQEKVNEAKRDLIKLEARRELILRQISEGQKSMHKSNSNTAEEIDKMKKVLNQKKIELDAIKTGIKTVFVKIGIEAQKEGLK